MCIFCTPLDEKDPTVRLSDAEILEAERCPNLADRAPTTIITGFLGAGKTTLLNHMLRGAHGKRFCVLQNEFGAVPVDDALIVRSDTFAEVAVITLATGCVCCKVRGDLVEGLRSLARGLAGGGTHFDGIIVETSGLSEAAPVCQTFFADAFVQRNFRLDAVLALVDAEAAPRALELLVCSCDALDAPPAVAGSDSDSDDDDDDDGSASSDESGAEPDADADADADAREAAFDRKLRVQAARLLCKQLCLADVVLLNKLDLVDEAGREAAEQLVHSVNPTARLLWCSHGRVDVDALLEIGTFTAERALQVDPAFLASRPPPGPDPAQPFAFVARPARPMRPAADEAAGGEHLHDMFGSVGLEAAAPIDELSFNDWLEAIFRRHGARLFRAKGVLFFRGVDGASTVQCVGTHVEIERAPSSCGEAGADEAPGGAGGAGSLPEEVLERRRSRLVFIGRTASIEAELREGFGRLAGG